MEKRPNAVVIVPSSLPFLNNIPFLIFADSPLLARDNSTFGSHAAVFFYVCVVFECAVYKLCETYIGDLHYILYLLFILVTKCACLYFRS